ncbi:hypothetical protein BRI6_0868 [plant metagenome]
MDYLLPKIGMSTTNPSHRGNPSPRDYARLRAFVYAKLTNLKEWMKGVSRREKARGPIGLRVLMEGTQGFSCMTT